jgi:hypothetical protein
MTDMKPKNPDCPLHAGSAPGERTSLGGRSIDPRTTQAFHQLRFHTEDLALELAVRLRVLGKSLVAACPEWGMAGEKRTCGSVAYQNLRRQLDCFLGSQVERAFAGQHYFPVVRDYIQDSLPFELNDCAGDDLCRIELVERAISLLSEDIPEYGGFSGQPASTLTL